MEEGPSRQLDVLLHADVVGSTALVQLNETLAHQRIQGAFRRLSEIISSHGGTTHEIRDDALVAEFSKASDVSSRHHSSVQDPTKPPLKSLYVGPVVPRDAACRVAPARQARVVHRPILNGADDRQPWRRWSQYGAARLRYL